MEWRHTVKVCASASVGQRGKALLHRERRAPHSSVERSQRSADDSGRGSLFPEDCEGPRERADRRSSPQDSPIESWTIFGGGEQPGTEFEDRRDTENLDDVNAVSPHERESSTVQQPGDSMQRPLES